MYTIEYSKDGIAVADHESEKYALKLKTQDIKVSTESVVYYARVLVKEKILPLGTKIKFEDKTEEINSRGKIRNWPKGFCDYISAALDRLLDTELF